MPTTLPSLLPVCSIFSGTGTTVKFCSRGPLQWRGPWFTSGPIWHRKKSREKSRTFMPNITKTGIKWPRWHRATTRNNTRPTTTVLIWGRFCTHGRFSTKTRTLNRWWQWWRSRVGNRGGEGKRRVGSVKWWGVSRVTGVQNCILQFSSSTTHRWERA